MISPDTLAFAIENANWRPRMQAPVVNSVAVHGAVALALLTLMPTWYWWYRTDVWHYNYTPQVVNIELQRPQLWEPAVTAHAAPTESRIKRRDEVSDGRKKLPTPRKMTTASESAKRPPEALEPAKPEIIALSKPLPTPAPTATPTPTPTPVQKLMPVVNASLPIVQQRGVSTFAMPGQWAGDMPASENVSVQKSYTALAEPMGEGGVNKPREPRPVPLGSAVDGQPLASTASIAFQSPDYVVQQAPTVIPANRGNPGVIFGEESQSNATLISGINTAGTSRRYLPPSFVQTITQWEKNATSATQTTIATWAPALSHGINEPFVGRRTAHSTYDAPKSDPLEINYKPLRNDVTVALSVSSENRQRGAESIAHALQMALSSHCRPGVEGVAFQDYTPSRWRVDITSDLKEKRIEMLNSCGNQLVDDEAKRLIESVLQQDTPSMNSSEVMTMRVEYSPLDRPTGSYFAQHRPMELPELLNASFIKLTNYGKKIHLQIMFESRRTISQPVLYDARERRLGRGALLLAN